MTADVHTILNAINLLNNYLADNSQDNEALFLAACQDSVCNNATTRIINSIAGTVLECDTIQILNTGYL